MLRVHPLTAGSRVRIWLAACLASLVAATGVRAGIVPLDNQSQIFTRSVAGPIIDSSFDVASGTGIWNGLVLAEADDGNGTVCGSDMLVDVEMTDSTLYGAGGGRGIGGGISTFHHDGYGDLRLLFVVHQTQEYTAELALTQGNLPPGMGNMIGLFDLGINPYWRHSTFGPTSVTGRIAPGSYWLNARTSYTETAAGGSSDGFDVFVHFTTCTTPLVAGQPQDQTVSPGATIDLQLTPTSPGPSATASVATNTYQWRRNLENIADDGRIAGATTPHLTMTGAVAADSGRYDCVVTQGAIVEPSRQALVKVTGTTGVEATPVAPGVRLSPPRPNPFAASTRLEFELERSAPVSLTVYDALGRRTKSLLPTTAMPAGRFTVVWNGTDENGTRVPNGLYFIHLASGGVQLVQRAALMTIGN